MLLGKLSYLRKHNFGPLLYMTHCLLQNGPYLSTGIKPNCFARILSATWLILSLIAANGYKGIVTTGITAPLPKTTPYQLFTDLVDKNFKPKPDIKFYAEIAKLCLKNWWKSQIFETETKMTANPSCKTSVAFELTQVAGVDKEKLLNWYIQKPSFEKLLSISLWNSSVERILTDNEGYWVPPKPSQNDTSFQSAP